MRAAANLTLPEAAALAPGLHLLAGGRRIDPFLTGPRHAAFRLAPPVPDLVLASRTFRPAGDGRALGVAIARLRVLQADRAEEIAPGHPALAQGFHPPEPGWRWTRGAAVLPAALFARVTGPAVLAVGGFGPPLPPGAPSVPAVVLGGDSHPRDQPGTDALMDALLPLFDGEVIRQRDLLSPPADRQEPDIARRLARLAARLRGAPPPVLIGRSSGARVATLYAAAHPVRAVVCLGYPFQPPGAPPEPARFLHLPRVRAPVLIAQGRTDRYGPAGRIAAYPLPPDCRVLPVEASHEFDLDAAGWAGLARRIALFLADTAPEAA